MRIVDCQAHVHGRAFFEAHIGRREHPIAERAGDGYVFHTSNGSANPIPPQYCDIDVQLEEMSAHGIDAVISSMGAFNVDHLPVEQATELAMHLNQERADVERAHRGRFHGLALLPMQDAGAALATLEHAVSSLGLRGVCIGSNVNGESIAAPARRPVLARIAELGIPLFLHPTRSIDTTVAARDLIFTGVFDESPELTVVHPHLGGPLPDRSGRIDREHLRCFYTDTASASSAALAMAIEVYGSDRVLFASDYPYWSPDDGLEVVHATLPEGAIEDVLGGNADALLGLG